MKRRRRNREEIQELLVTIDRRLDYQSLNEICEHLGVHRATVHRWRKLYGLETTRKSRRLNRAEQDRLDAYKLAANGNLACPKRRREIVNLIQQKLGWSERRACEAIGQHRSTQRYNSPAKELTKVLKHTVVETKDKHPEWGARKIAVVVSQKIGTNRLRPEAAYYRMGLASKDREPKVANPREAILRAKQPNQIWACDITKSNDASGRPLCWLGVIDEFTRECLRLRVRSAWTGTDVAKQLAVLADNRGIAVWIRTDNEELWKSPQLNKWLAQNHIGHRLIRHGAPWENGVVESFFGQLHRELLNSTKFYSAADADAQAGIYRNLYNLVRPHGAINWQTPASYRQQVSESSGFSNADNSSE